LYGDVSFRAAAQLRDPAVFKFFTECIQRVAPKSTLQAAAEIKVCAKFLENFSGDQVS
jgi:1-pyrroline-5-carboxylate dehydrogenase